MKIYEYLADTFPEMINGKIKASIDGAGELKGAVIAMSTKEDELCKMTMEIFIEAYGSEAGVAALKWLPHGGLYLTGGLTPKNMDFITGMDGRFMKAFKDKGRVSGILDSIPVYAVLVENLGERGAHYLAFKMLLELETKKMVARSDGVGHLVADVHGSDDEVQMVDECAGWGFSSTVLTPLAVGVGIGALAASTYCRCKR